MSTLIKHIQLAKSHSPENKQTTYLNSSSLCLGQRLLLFWVWLTTPTGRTFTIFSCAFLSLVFLGESSTGGHNLMMTVACSRPVGKVLLKTTNAIINTTIIYMPNSHQQKHLRSVSLHIPWWRGWSRAFPRPPGCPGNIRWGGAWRRPRPGLVAGCGERAWPRALVTFSALLGRAAPWAWHLALFFSRRCTHVSCKHNIKIFNIPSPRCAILDK